MKTAVEWLLEQINPYGVSVHQDLFEQALKMEKEQKGYTEKDVRNAINLVKKYDEWSIEHGESFFAYIEDQIIQQLKLKQQEQ
jgi:hypothetical protein